MDRGTSRILVDGRPAEFEPAGDRSRPGVFTTIRVHRGRPLFLADHLLRLVRSAAELGLPAVDPDRIASEIAEAAGDGDARVRVSVLPARSGSTRIVHARELVLPGAAWRLAPVRFEPPPFPHVKTTERSAYVDARRLAGGADDALLWNGDEILECTIANVFLVSGSVLRTPPPSSPLLAGIARHHVLEVACGMDMVPEQRPLRRADVEAAEACFVSNAVLLAHPVDSVEGWARFRRDERVERLRDTLLRRGAETV